MSADGSAGAVEKIKPAQPSFDFKLQATGSVRGKLVGNQKRSTSHELQTELLVVSTR